MIPKTIACQGGFTYIGVLFAVVFISTGLAATGSIWSTTAKHAKEQELLYVGGEFRNAIRSYYLNTPGGVHQFPRSLDDLLEDRRGSGAARHLRNIRLDPITGTYDWNLITTADGAIIGVSSRSNAQPMKRANFSPENTVFEDAACYCDWRFIYLPQLKKSES